MTLRILWTTLEMKYFTAIRNAVCKSHWNSMFVGLARCHFSRTYLKKLRETLCLGVPSVQFICGDWKNSGVVLYHILCAILCSQNRNYWEGWKMTAVPSIMSAASITIQASPKTWKECRSNVRMRERNDGKRKVNIK